MRTREPMIEASTCGFPLCENADLLRQVVSTPRKVCYLRLDHRLSRAFQQVQIKTASRLGLLPPYLFAELDRLKKEVPAKASTLSASPSATPTCPLRVTSSSRSSAPPTIRKNHRYPDYEGLPQFRAGQRRLVPAPLRRQLRPSARGLRADRLEGRHREFRDRRGRSRRHRADSRSRLSGLLLGMRLQRRRAVLPAAPKRKRIRSRSRLDSRRSCAPRKGVVAQLSQQSDRRDC